MWENEETEYSTKFILVNTINAEHTRESLFGYREASPVVPCIGRSTNDVVLASMLAQRIAHISVNRNIEMRPSASHGTSQLWINFHEIMNRILQSINHDLLRFSDSTTEELLQNKVPERIRDIAFFEAYYSLYLHPWTSS